MEFKNAYEDARYAEAYAKLEFPGTYYLAYRDLLAAVLLVLALAGCNRAASPYSETSPARTCTGRLVLEFTNHSMEPVQVGWIPASDSGTASVSLGPTWLGTIGRGTARYTVARPGYVIFRTANPAGLTGEHHDVTHRMLCVQGK